MQRSWLVLAAFAAFTMSASRASAQIADRTSAAAGPTMSAAAVAPRLSSAPSGDQSAFAPDAPLPRASSSGLDNGEKLMIIGGAAFIAGAIIGDTPGAIIMIGGAGVGLYGLYLHLGRPKGDTEIGLQHAF